MRREIGIIFKKPLHCWGFQNQNGAVIFSSLHKNRRKNNPDVKSGLFLKNPSIAGAFKIKMVQLFFHRYIRIEGKIIPM
ncbi:MAG: hypothetical protein H6577_24340 [Lewinellaceae bacterium]|nr:hypothetical protein [Lewinellaceae bacterium]